MDNNATDKPPALSGDTMKIDNLSVEKQKSSGIWIAALLFGVIFLSIIITNYVLAQSLAADSRITNIAGRQRMLTQRVAKSIEAIDIALLHEDTSEGADSQVELKDSYELFSKTLSSFRDGGKTIDAKGESIDLDPVEDRELHDIVVKASKIWEEIAPGILYVATDELASLDLARVEKATKVVAQNNIELLNLMNSLTVGLEAKSRSKFLTLEGVLAVALLLVILTFAYIIKTAIGTMKTAASLAETQTELNSSNEKLNSSLATAQKQSEEAQARADELQDITLNLNSLREESDTIFNSIDHGLCLLDKKFKIGSRISQSTYDIFETERLSGLSFLDLMRPLITEKDLKTLESFLGLQFKSQTLDSQLDKFNPLKKVEVTLNFDGDDFSKKHLGFEFERVYDENDDIAAILVTITDVTETVALENELKRAGEEQARKTDLILEIISSDSTELELFLAKTDKDLDLINNNLKDKGVDKDSSASNKDLVEDVFRIVHNIKGNASMLGLETVTELTHSVEDKLAGLRGRKNVKGEEFLAALVQLATLRERLTDYEDIIQTILKDFASSGSKKSSSKPLTKNEKFTQELSKFNGEIAQDLDKKVFTRCDVDIDSMSDSGFSTMKDIIIQIARNSVVHGIEAPATRTSLGKLEEGLFTVLCKLDESSDNVLGKPAYYFTFRDDGAGLDVDALKRKSTEQRYKN